jgi:hypothetical protein
MADGVEETAKREDEPLVRYIQYSQYRLDLEIIENDAIHMCNAEMERGNAHAMLQSFSLFVCKTMVHCNDN